MIRNYFGSTIRSTTPPSDEVIEVGRPDPNQASAEKGFEITPLDPIADGLLIHLETLGNICGG